MAQFVQLKSGESTFIKSGESTFKKCLEAINKIAKNELWLDSFNKEAKERKVYQQ